MGAKAKKRYADPRRAMTEEQRAEAHEVRKKHSAMCVLEVKERCVKCGKMRVLNVSRVPVSEESQKRLEEIKKEFVCPYCRLGVRGPKDAARANRPQKAGVARKVAGPRPKSGEAVLIELMLEGFCSREFLKDETGLSENSVKMYVNGYLERVRHKPYRVVRKGDDQFKLVKMEVGSGA